MIRQILCVYTQGIIGCITGKTSLPSLTVCTKDAFSSSSSLTLTYSDDWQVVSMQSFVLCPSVPPGLDTTSDTLAHERKRQKPWFNGIFTEKNSTHRRDGCSQLNSSNMSCPVLIISNIGNNWLILS